MLTPRFVALDASDHGQGHSVLLAQLSVRQVALADRANFLPVQLGVAGASCLCDLGDANLLITPGVRHLGSSLEVVSLRDDFDVLRIDAEWVVAAGYALEASWHLFVPQLGRQQPSRGAGVLAGGGLVVQHGSAVAGEALPFPAVAHLGVPLHDLVFDVAPVSGFVLHRSTRSTPASRIICSAASHDAAHLDAASLASPGRKVTTLAIPAWISIAAH